MSSRNPEKINAIIEAAGGWILDHPKFAHFSIRPRGTNSKILLYEYTIDRKVPPNIIEESCRAEVDFIQSVLKDYEWDDQFEVVYEVLDKETCEGDIPDAPLEFMVDSLNDEWLKASSDESDTEVWSGVMSLGYSSIDVGVGDPRDMEMEKTYYVKYPENTTHNDALQDMINITNDFQKISTTHPMHYKVDTVESEIPDGYDIIPSSKIREVLGL